MLEINTETVCRLIQLAHQFHAQEEVVIPNDPDGSSDDWARQVLAAHSDDSTLAEFRSIIEDLDPDQQQQIVALLWLGRGDYALEDWEELLEEAATEWNESTADYLIAHPMLGDYLAEGLDMHGYSCD